MNARDIIRDAFQGIGVVAVDEAAQAYDVGYGLAKLEALFAELQTSPGMTAFASLTVDTIPVKYRIPLSDLLGCDLAPAYGATPVCQRATAIVRLRAVQNVYERDMDLDEDGEVSDDEEDAFDAGAFF